MLAPGHRKRGRATGRQDGVGKTRPRTRAFEPASSNWIRSREHHTGPQPNSAASRGPTFDSTWPTATNSVLNPRLPTRGRPHTILGHRVARRSPEIPLDWPEMASEPRRGIKSRLRAALRPARCFDQSFMSRRRRSRQICAPVRGLDLVPNHLRERCLDDLKGMVRLLNRPRPQRRSGAFRRLETCVTVLQVADTLGAPRFGRGWPGVSVRCGDDDQNDCWRTCDLDGVPERWMTVSMCPRFH